MWVWMTACLLLPFAATNSPQSPEGPYSSLTLLAHSSILFLSPLLIVAAIAVFTTLAVVYMYNIRIFTSSSARHELSKYWKNDISYKIEDTKNIWGGTPTECMKLFFPVQLKKKVQS